MTKTNYKKIILSTALFTLVALIICSVIFTIVMTFGFTKTFADFMYDLGMNNFASSLYYRVYEKEDNIYYCYKSLNIEIKQQDYKNIIKYYEEFSSHEDYNEFIDSCKANNERLDIGNLQKSTLLDEENYLRFVYIKALIKVDKVEDAWSKSTEDFIDIAYITLNDKGLYSLSLFVENYSDYEKIFGTKKLYELMQDYFNDCNDVFENNKDKTDNASQAYLISLGNRIITIGQDLNCIYNRLHINESLIDDNISKLTTINQAIKGLV